jgi:[acyl-carrier-protein] S-malonyltransferase
MSLAEEAGSRKVVRLPITIAAHSQLMAPAATGFAEAVDNTPIAAPHMPVIGNTTAGPMTTPEAIRDELKSQLMGSVRWTETIQYMVSQGVDTFVEVGPGNVLLNLVKRIDRKSTRLQFEV